MAQFLQQEDSFERIYELGGNIAKKGAKKIAKTAFSSVSSAGKTVIESMLGTEYKGPEKRDKAEPRNYTPIDNEKLAALEEEYKSQDAQKEKRIKAILENLSQYNNPSDQAKVQEAFSRYKEEEKQYYEKRRRERQQEEKQKEYIEAQKKEEEKKRAAETPLPEPKGKERKSIFAVARKRKASVETRAVQGHS